MKKRLLSLLLALVLVFSLMPVSALAAETEEPAPITSEESAAEPAEEPTAEPAEEPAAEPAEELASEPAEEPASESAEGLTAEPAEEPAADLTEEPTAEPKPIEEKKVLRGAAEGDNEIVASGNCGAQGDNVTWTLDENGVLTITGTGEMENFFLGTNPWASNRDSVHIVEIGFGVTSVGDSAFYFCANLSSVALPAGVTSIGDSAFRGCSSLTGITLPAGVTSVGDSAFSDCRSLTEINLPAGVTSIGDSAFSGCSSLTGITLPGALSSIGRDAFYLCSGMTGAVVIPEGVTSISDNAFFRCSGLTSITLPENLTSIGMNAFLGCSTLPAILIPESVRSIGEAAFSECSGLTGVIIPEGVTSIEKYAFSWCDALASVTLPMSLTSIAEGVFDGCNSLADVYYGGTAEDWAAIEIGSSNELLTNASIHYTGAPAITLTAHYVDRRTNAPVQEDGEVTFAFVEGSGYLDAAPAIEGYSFSYEKVGGSYGARIEQRVTDGETAYYLVDYQGQATLITESTEITYYYYVPVAQTALPTAVYQNEAGDTLRGSETLSFDENGELWFVEMPDGSETYSLIAPEIDGYTIQEIRVADGQGFTCTVTPTWGLRIKGWDDYYGAWNAYWGGPRSANNGWEGASATGALTCTYVYAAVGPQIVASGECGANLTWTLDDTGLLTISGSGDMTVYTASWGVNPTPWADYTKRISAISLPDGLTSISRYAFYGISSMTEIAIPATVTDIGEDAFENCSGLVSVSIPEGVTEISRNLFFDCTGLTAVTIPSTVNSIGEWAFYGCSSLESVVIPTGVTVIPSRTFSGCTSLASISLPEGLTTIEDSSFMLCAMTDIVIPSTVTSIGDYAFANCPNLTGFTIPEGVSVINSGLFSNCPAMTVVTIPVTVTSVGDYAFNSCRNLTDVQYGGTETDRTQITFGSNNEKLQNATWHYHGAPAIIDQGTCGVNLTWTLDADGVLTIFGTGEMADFLNSWDPWYNKGVVTAVIEEGVTSIGGGAFAHCAELTSVSIPISVTTIGDDAFSSCSSLISVTIPAGVTSIGSSAFIFSSSLETISVADGNLSYCSIDGSLYSSDGTELCAVPGAKTGGFTIPEGVTSINDRAFQTCGNLTEITIPASVTSIGEWAFGYCESLESLTIPAGVESIANALFCNCTSLASVSIPESVMSIGENAFINCAALTDVYYGGTKAQWDALGYQFSNSTPMIHFEKHTPGTPVRENVIPATAETEGNYDEVVYCSVCGAEISRESKTIPKIQLDKPVISSVSNAANGVQIKWKAVPDAAQYRVYRKTESSSSWSKVTDTTATSCTDTKTESGTTYIYSVRCLSSNGSFPTSAMSGTKSIKYIAAPALPTASNVSGGVQLNWTAVPGAEKYRVFRKVEGGSWAKLGDTAETTYTDTTGESGTKYFYTIRCVSADGKTMTSAYNTTGKSIVFYVLGTPGLPTLSNVTGGVRISWTAVNGAEKYRVFRKVEGGSWAKLVDTTGTAYTDKTGEVGTKYFYTIRCIASDGKTYTSAYNTTGKSIVFYVLGTPGLPTLSNVTGGVRISWTAVNGAEKYRVFRKVEGGSWAKLVDTTGTAYTDKTGVVGTKYFYTIRCLAADGKSYTSANNAAGKSIVYYELGTPGLPTLTDVTGGIRISWTAINNAEKYRVFRKAEGGNWAKLVDTTGTAYTDKSGEVGTKYFYTIRCISTDGKTYTSAYNTTGKSMVFYVFGPPALPTLSKVSGGVKITWTATNGAEKYRVFRKAEGGSWVKVADTTGTAYTDKSGVSGTTYYYTIRCISADGKTYTSAYNTTGRSIVY